MRKNYVKPLLNSEEFVPQTYIAACKEGEYYDVYNFICNAGFDNNQYDVFIESNGQEGLQRGTELFGGDKKLTGTIFGTSFHQCSATHTVTVPTGQDVSNVFQPGYMTKNWNLNDTGTPVIVWTDNGTNIHCTSSLSVEKLGTFLMS